MINMPLKTFGKSFKLDVEKEIMPYQLYTQDNIDKINYTFQYSMQPHTLMTTT